MAAPYPPAGGQKQYNERPLKVYGEQYLEGRPIPIGVRTAGPAGELVPPYLIDGQGRYQPVRFSDWVVSNRYTGAAVEVLSNEEFTERFGGTGADTT